MKQYGNNLEAIMTDLQRQRRSNSADYENRTNLKTGYVATFTIMCKSFFNWLAKKTLGVSLEAKGRQLTYEAKKGRGNSKLAAKFAGGDDRWVEEEGHQVSGDLRSRGRSQRRNQGPYQAAHSYHDQRGHNSQGGRMKTYSSYSYNQY